MPDDRVRPSPTSVARVLAIAASALVFIGLVGQMLVYLGGHDRVFGLVRLFDLNGEKNVPAIFSGLLLLFAALLLGIITSTRKKRADGDTGYWALLTLGFLYMAADEVFSFHERSTEPLRALLENAASNVLYYAWVVPGVAVVLLLALLYAGFLRRLPADTRHAFLLAAALYLGGCIGVEMIGGAFDAAYGQQHLVYALISSLEEALEMAGVIVFIWALLVYMQKDYGSPDGG